MLSVDMNTLHMPSGFSGSPIPIPPPCMPFQMLQSIPLQLKTTLSHSTPIPHPIPNVRRDRTPSPQWQLAEAAGDDRRPHRAP